MCACPETETVGHIVIGPAMPYSRVVTPSPTTEAIRADSVTLTASDQGSTVLLLVGDTIDIDLSTISSPFIVDDAVLRPVIANGGYPGSSSAEAVFRAVKAGNTSIVATANGSCPPTIPSCPHPATMWRVTVVVDRAHHRPLETE
jgi:hypothetical protein